MTPEIRYSAGTRYEAPRVFPEYSPDHEFRVLNWEDWRFWRDNGYLVIRDLIPKEQCEELIKVTCDFLGVQRTTQIRGTISHPDLLRIRLQKALQG